MKRSARAHPTLKFSFGIQLPMSHQGVVTTTYGYDAFGSRAPHFSFLNYGPILTFLVTDNLKSELFSANLSPFVRMMNARHMIYHHIHGNLADCRHRKGPREGAEELIKYSRLFVLDWASQVIRDGTLVPPFLMPIKRDLIFDVLFERKSIFTYFNRTNLQSS